jgi:hypothetical protein
MSQRPTQTACITCCCTAVTSPCSKSRRGRAEELAAGRPRFSSRGREMHPACKCPSTWVWRSAILKTTSTISCFKFTTPRRSTVCDRWKFALIVSLGCSGDVKDYTGVTMQVTPERPRNLAAVYIFVGGNTIPKLTPGKPTTNMCVCEFIRCQVDFSIFREHVVSVQRQYRYSSIRVPDTHTHDGSSGVGILQTRQKVVDDW